MVTNIQFLFVVFDLILNKWLHCFHSLSVNRFGFKDAFMKQKLKMFSWKVTEITTHLQGIMG